MSDPRYKTRRWKKRAAWQMKVEPTCRMCAARGIERTATVADHIDPHRGDDHKFWHGELQSLCATCHSKFKQRIEARGFDDELDEIGWPTDPKHPANVKLHRVGGSILWSVFVVDRRREFFSQRRELGHRGSRIALSGVDYGVP